MYEIGISWPALANQDQSSHHIKKCKMHLSNDILPSSAPMRSISGVLESSRQALSIGSTCSFIGADFENHLG